MEQASLHSARELDRDTMQAVGLLQRLIATPSFSREEDKTAAIIMEFLTERKVEVLSKHNNVWCFNRHYNADLPLVLLNSHHDTVKPATGYTRDPYEAAISEGKLFGLGSNDAGGALVSLLMAFLHFSDKTDLRYNLAFAATAEEEISGRNGIESIIAGMGDVELAVIGEPTGMDMAIAEKGLMVLDCVSHGLAGHAAHSTGDNAIYAAMNDINWFRTYQFEKKSNLLGPVRMNVTMIKAGSQHNVVPGRCEFTVDVRTTDAMNNEEVLEIIRKYVACEVNPRSLRLNPSSLPEEHAFVSAGKALGLKTYGSPTISDQALLRCPSIKIGPGQSQRSHTSDEYIELQEISDGIRIYKKLLEKYLLT